MSAPTPVPEGRLRAAQAADKDLIDPDEAIDELDDPGVVLAELWREYKESADPGLAEIGLVLGVTESRICQLHTKAMMGKRARIGAVDDD
jgi:hypothetical protein